MKDRLSLRVLIDKDGKPFCSECWQKLPAPHELNKNQELICPLCSSPLEASVLKKQIQTRDA